MSRVVSILVDSSKEAAASVCAFVGDDSARFGELFALMLDGEYRVVQRASRPVSICVERHPELIGPYYPRLLKLLENEGTPVAVKRNVVRLLQFVDVPKRYRGRIFDVCYRLFADVNEAIAVRVFAMTVAANIARNAESGIEDLMNELRTVAALHPEKATAAMRSRVRRVLK